MTKKYLSVIPNLTDDQLKELSVRMDEVEKGTRETFIYAAMLVQEKIGWEMQVRHEQSDWDSPAFYVGDGNYPMSDRDIERYYLDARSGVNDPEPVEDDEEPWIPVEIPSDNQLLLEIIESRETCEHKFMSEVFREKEGWVTVCDHCFIKEGGFSK